MRTFIARTSAALAATALLTAAAAGVAAADADVNTWQGGTGNVNSSTVINTTGSFNNPGWVPWPFTTYATR